MAKGIAGWSVSQVLPRDRWYVRPFLGLKNTYRRFKHDPFRAHAHSNDAIA